MFQQRSASSDMSMSKRSNFAETFFAWDLVSAARHNLGGRRALVILATVVVTAGVALNWNWLVALRILG